MRILKNFFLILMFSSSIFSSDTIALLNGKLVFISNFGKDYRIIENGVILIKKDRIYKIGKANKVKLPESVKKIDLNGMYVLPGLIDGFAAVNNQNYCNAYLYSGVTSIIAVSGGRRGDLYLKCKPSPALFKLEGIGEEKISNEEIVNTLYRFKKKGYRVALLMYKLTPEQVKIAVKEAHSLGISTIGELGFTKYLDAISYGVDAFVHTTRYSLDLAPREMAESVAKEPFSDNLNSPKWKYYKWLTDVNLSSPKIKKKIKEFASKHPVLIPTFGLLYLDTPWHENPWNEKVSILISPETVNNPADRITGNHDYDEEHLKAYRELALKQYEIEKMYYREGARYLTGSGTDVWGSMPGIFLHYELEALEKIGLSIPEVLAAATSNFSDVFGWRIGKLKEGFKADLLILEESPLKSLKNLKKIKFLINKGKIIKRENLLRRKK